MNALNLRAVPANVAAACTELGRGRWLDFASADEPVRLRLGPLLATDTLLEQEALHLSCQHGPLHLRNADALLSLCGETPVVSAGPAQAWYWQRINQQLGQTLQALLSPLQPVPARPLVQRIDCLISVERGAEQAHGVLSCSADTLLRLFDATAWQHIEQPLPADWPLHFPLVMGRISLTVSELRSLRPGDVVLPTELLFDSNGHGQVRLGNRQWAVASEARNDYLQLRLIHQEDLHHEH